MGDRHLDNITPPACLLYLIPTCKCEVKCEASVSCCHVCLCLSSCPHQDGLLALWNYKPKQTPSIVVLLLVVLIMVSITATENLTNTHGVLKPSSLSSPMLNQVDHGLSGSVLKALC